SGSSTANTKPGSTIATADYWPRDSWSFAGYGTPANSFQSSLWAAANGDLKKLAAGTTIDMQAMLTQDFGGKSETESATRIMDQVSTIKSVTIANREMISADTALLTVDFEDRDKTHQEKMLMKLVDGEWKVSGPPK